jgi:type II secretory pathway component PulC
MEQRSPSPEKQLLRLIEEPRAGTHIQKTILRRQGLKFFSPVVLKARFSFLKESIKRSIALWRQQRFDFKTFNRVLELFIAILIIYAISGFLLSLIHLKKITNSKVNIEEKPVDSAELEIASFLKAPSYYLNKVRTRDIFKMAGNKTEETVISKQPPSSETIQLTKDLNLVGISWSEDPDVMIEDTKEKKTYFLKRGQAIKGLKVEAVFKDKVILSHEGEEIELR